MIGARVLIDIIATESIERTDMNKISDSLSQINYSPDFFRYELELINKSDGSYIWLE